MFTERQFFKMSTKRPDDAIFTMIFYNLSCEGKGAWEQDACSGKIKFACASSFTEASCRGADLQRPMGGGFRSCQSRRLRLVVRLPMLGPGGTDAYSTGRDRTRDALRDEGDICSVPGSGTPEQSLSELF